MTLIQTIQTELMRALKAGDSRTKDTLRFIVSQIKYKEIELKRPATDDEIISAIRKQIKELEEASAQFIAAGRTDLSDENSAQIAILRPLLPQELGDEELLKEIHAFVEAQRDIQAANPRAFTGKVVGALKSKADPSRISALYGRMIK